jgi:hypothetical protein
MLDCLMGNRELVEMGEELFPCPGHKRNPDIVGSVCCQP